MSRFSVVAEDRTDYYMIVEPQSEGPVIGTYAGSPITETVLDGFGRRYAYAGAAPCRRDGRYDIEVLASGEFILEPGLLYRMAASKPADGLARARSQRGRYDATVHVIAAFGFLLVVHVLLVALRGG